MIKRLGDNFMRTQLRENYISRAAWFRDVVGDEDLILRRKSAIEYWAYFSGYANDNEIDVYANPKGSLKISIIMW